MFVNYQQILFIILFLCELISLHKIHMISLFLFIYFSFLLFLRSWQNNQALDSTLIFIIYSSRTRLHRGIIKEDSKLDHTKKNILRDQDISKRIKLSGKDRNVMVIRYRGTSPKLGSCQGEFPCPCDYISFAGEVGNVVDDVELSSIFQGIGSPS